MKKRLMATVLLIVTLCSAFALIAYARDYTGSVNTFDVYKSGNYKQITKNNSGMTMVSENENGTEGTITIDYKMPNGMYNGATIIFYCGGMEVGRGKVTTGSSETFGSITKIDSLGEGFYFKYSK